MKERTVVGQDGELVRVLDPHATEFPAGELWEKIYHQVLRYEDAEAIAAEHDADADLVADLRDAFWTYYERTSLLDYGAALGLAPAEMVAVDQEELERLVQEKEDKIIPQDLSPWSDPFADG